MTRSFQTAPGSRRRQSCATRFEARIARAQADMFQSANDFIDLLISAKDDPARRADLIELVAASQYGGVEGNVAARARAAASRVLGDPENGDIRRQFLGYLVYEVQSPAFNLQAKGIGDPAPAAGIQNDPGLAAARCLLASPDLA